MVMHPAEEPPADGLAPQRQHRYAARSAGLQAAWDSLCGGAAPMLACAAR